MRRGCPIAAAAVLIAVVVLRSHLTDHPDHPDHPAPPSGGGLSDSGPEPQHSRHGDAAELHHHHLEHVHQLNEDRGEHDTAHRHPRAQIAQIDPHDHAAHAHGAAMSSPPPPPDQFCSSNEGGMVMFMDGFNVSPQRSKTCLVFLMKHAVIDTSGKYFGAIVGAILLGLVTELARSNGLIKKMVPWFKTIGGGAALFAAQMTLAYLMMLLVMSYDVGLLFGCIAGLTMGHVIKDLKKRHTKKMKRGKLNSSSSALLIQASNPINARHGEEYESDSSDLDDNALDCCAPGDDTDDSD